LIESLDLRPSNQYILVSESPSCLDLEKNVCVPGNAAIEMKSKVFDMVLLRYLQVIYMDRWAVSRFVVNVIWTELVSLALIRQSRSED
jgi:hypothetical protein